jgi:hypothetical protein
MICTASDVHEFIDGASLESILRVLADEPHILKFVLWETIYRQARTQDNELERRLAFMQLFNSPDRKEIAKLIEATHSENRETAIFIAITCTRSFLERLFLLMVSIKEVLETRIEICLWLEGNDQASDTLVREEREALERELSNLDARSDLDSTRVHVDEDALREWYSATQSTISARYIQTVLAEGPSVGTGSTIAALSSFQKKIPQDDDDLSADAQIGSEVLLVSIVDETLKAFATDRSFGLDAYLSRRIRHGTLSGQIMTPVTRALRRLPELISIQRETHNLVGDNSPEEIIDHLIRTLSLIIDNIRKEIIQLRSDGHPQGLITATWRTTSNAAHLDAMMSRVRERVISSRGSYQIFGDVYGLCWDCLEPDLAQLRLYMIRSFLPNAIGSLRECFNSLRPEEQVIASPVFGEVQKTLEARVQEVCGWFIRPVFRRDKYDLRMLIDSTLSIVRELDEDYRFAEHVNVVDEISLSRGSFDVIGDALFVLLGNAARHGSRDGVVTVTARHDPSSMHALINIESEVPTREEHITASARIMAALAPGASRLDDRAAVEEGYSGLKKLAGIIERVRSDDARLAFSADEDAFTLNFAIYLPEEIIISRGQS